MVIHLLHVPLQSSETNKMKAYSIPLAQGGILAHWEPFTNTCYGSGADVNEKSSLKEFLVPFRTHQVPGPFLAMTIMGQFHGKSYQLNFHGEFLWFQDPSC